MSNSGRFCILRTISHHATPAVTNASRTVTEPVISCFCIIGDDSEPPALTNVPISPPNRAMNPTMPKIPKPGMTKASMAIQRMPTTIAMISHQPLSPMSAPGPMRRASAPSATAPAMPVPAVTSSTKTAIRNKAISTNRTVGLTMKRTSFSVGLSLTRTNSLAPKRAMSSSSLLTIPLLSPKSCIRSSRITMADEPSVM